MAGSHGERKMNTTYAAEKLRLGVERATVQDKYDIRVSDPNTQKKYSSAMANFIGHPVPNTAEAYVKGINNAVTQAMWNRRPTNVEKWIKAMEKVS